MYPHTAVSTAAYLRCFPSDQWGMEAHRAALLRQASQMGLAEPLVYLDNGCRSKGPLPRLRSLLDLVAAGLYRVVLIPGPFVFSLDDDVAREVIRWISAHGCAVVELSAH
jgi:hypothetical protein